MKKLIRTAAALFCAALCFALMAAAAPAEDIASGVSGTCSCASPPRASLSSAPRTARRARWEVWGLSRQFRGTSIV
ncbi:MAG: hypothetical protein IJU78_00325 [Clostridia bacterium]|nr:hypothetical protein [Clostridia bacterium]